MHVFLQREVTGSFPRQHFVIDATSAVNVSPALYLVIGAFQFVKKIYPVVHVTYVCEDMNVNTEMKVEPSTRLVLEDGRRKCGFCLIDRIKY